MSEARRVATALIGMAIFAVAGLAAQEAPLRIVERADWSRWRDGTYIGHAWREGRATLLPVEGGSDSRKGEWFLLEETLRDQRAEAKALDESGSTRFNVGPLGAIGDDGLSPTPSLRGLLDISRAISRLGMPDPALVVGGDPLKMLPTGSSFIAPGLRVLRLRDSWYRIPFLAEYRVVGTGRYANRPIISIKAKFATRLPDRKGELATAAGAHSLDIGLDAETGLPLLVRDVFDEAFTFSDGGTERMAGSNLVFWSGGDKIGSGELLAEVGKALGIPGTRDSSLYSAGPGEVESSGDLPPAPSPDLATAALGASGSGIEVGPGVAGLTLRIPDLRFVADSATLLPAEAARLDLVAKALSAAPPDRNFLVEGHAASTGKPQGELELSSLRAKSVVDALVARGLAAARFIWRGLGSAQPIAPNDSEAGRARNRRVEITILD